MCCGAELDHGSILVVFAQDILVPRLEWDESLDIRPSTALPGESAF